MEAVDPHYGDDYASFVELQAVQDFLLRMMCLTRRDNRIHLTSKQDLKADFLDSDRGQELCYRLIFEMAFRSPAIDTADFNLSNGISFKQL